MRSIAIVGGIVTLIEATLGMMELKDILDFLNVSEEEKDFSSLIKEFNNGTIVIKD